MIENRFHWVAQGYSKGIDVECDIDLTPDSEFALVPTLGSLVVGWVLIIPRIVSISAAKLPDFALPHLHTAVSSAAQKVAHLANRVFYFEHGPGTKGANIGCGVDQTHVHVVPLNLDLIGMALDDIGLKWFEVSPANPWKQLNPSQPYYLVSDIETAYATYPRCETSQYFRRLIARGLDRPNEWDFRVYPHYENVRRTIRFFHQYS